MSNDQPFDQAFFELLMADLDRVSERNRQGFQLAANVAARIAAERVPVSDEVLTETIQYVLNDLGVWQNIAPHIAGAVRAAITPTVPVIPAGWKLRHIIPAGDQFCAVLDWDDWSGTGDHRCISRFAGNPFDALTAACEAAQGEEDRT